MLKGSVTDIDLLIIATFKAQIKHLLYEHGNQKYCCNQREKSFGIFSFWRAEIIGETVTFYLHFSNVDWFKTKDMLLLLICEQN